MNDKDIMKEVCSKASSIREAIEMLGLRSAGGNYSAFKNACKKHDLKIPVCDKKIQTKKARDSRKIKLSDILVENSTYRNRTSLKNKLFNANLLENKCYKCGMNPIWMGEKITLHLEHKNGIYNDHRLENLEILCPNCHSQTKTFAGRNK